MPLDIRAKPVEVEDQGIGIPEDKLGDIFESFYQVDSSATRQHNGQGVGLAICQDIVRHHDGRIWAENVEPTGTRVTVLLPRRPAVLQPADPDSLTSLPFEAGELMEHFQWLSEAQSYQLADHKRDAVALELADILIFLLRIAERLDLDPVAAAWRKIEINEARYPADKVRGDARRASEYDD